MIRTRSITSLNTAGCCIILTYLISSCQKLGSHFVEVSCFSGVNVSHHFLHDVIVHVSDFDAILFAFLQIMFKHGVKHQRPSYKRNTEILDTRRATANYIMPANNMTRSVSLGKASATC